MKKTVIVLISVAIILSAGFVAMDFLSSQKKSPPERKPPEVKNYVKTVEVIYDEVDVNIEAYGRVGSSRRLNLTAEVGGKLEYGAIPLKEGQNFSEGQLLFKINNTEEKLTLQSRKSSFLNLLASILPDFKIDFKNNYQSWRDYFEIIDLNKDLPPLPEIKSTKEKTFLASKNILTEYYAIKSLEENLKKYYFYAPYNGSITAVNIEVGSVVNPGNNIASIIRTNQLELKVPCKIEDISFVQEGSKVKVISESDESISWEGIVVRKGDYVDQTNQSINVFIKIDNGLVNDIYDGLFLKAIIPGRAIPNAMTIPRNILRNKNEVFIEQDGLLKSKKVVIHKIDKDSAVVSGIKEGQSLVVEAPANASKNMKVEIVDEKA